MSRSEIGRNAIAENDIHAACQDGNCSVSTIRKLLEKLGPEALHEKDAYGRVPLFHAIRNKCSLPVIHMLLDTFPEAILEADACGELPLHMLFHPHSDHRVLQHVLHKDPSLALFSEKTFSGSQILLQTLCTHWGFEIKNYILREEYRIRMMKLRNPKLRDEKRNKTQKQNQRAVVPRNKVFSDSELLNRWRKLVLLVRAAHRHTTAAKTIDATDSNSNATTTKTPTTDNDDDIPELHVALQLKCLPRYIIAQFIEVYPEHAAKPVLGKRKEDSSLVVRPRKQQQHRSLPLHLAISTQRLSWNEGLRDLVYAHPSALFQEDCKKLVPFLQQATAANNKNENDEESYDTVYCLLREDPSVLSRILSTR